MSEEKYHRITYSEKVYYSAVFKSKDEDDQSEKEGFFYENADNFKDWEDNPEPVVEEITKEEFDEACNHRIKDEDVEEWQNG